MVRSFIKSLPLWLFNRHPRVQAMIFEQLNKEGVHFFKFLDDHMIAFYPNDTIGRFIKQTGEFDRKSVIALKAHLKAIGKSVDGIKILEIGANIGTQSIYFCKEFENCDVIAVEPDPQNMRLLKANIFCNDLQSQVCLVLSGVSNQEGTLDFIRNSYNNGASSLLENVDAECWAAEGVLKQGYEKIQVRVQPIDTMLIQMGVDPGQIGLIWMDVEGHEGKVFAGMEHILARHRPPLYFEFTPERQSEESRDLLLRTIQKTYEEAFINRGCFEKIKISDIKNLSTKCDLLLV